MARIYIISDYLNLFCTKMPEKYGPPADTYKALQIVEYLRKNTNIRVVYPYAELMSAKEVLKENIYYKTDTHWNYIGGYIGAAALLKELGIEIPSIESNEITITADSNIAGDLAGMLNLKKYLIYTDHEYTVKGYNTHNVSNIKWDFPTVFIYHAENADPRKIYIYRDSFATRMSVYIGSQFTDTYMRHKNTYSYEDFAEQDPDIFVYETVERYADKLMTFSIQ